MTSQDSTHQWYWQFSPEHYEETCELRRVRYLHQQSSVLSKYSDIQSIIGKEDISKYNLKDQMQYNSSKEVFEFKSGVRVSPLPVRSEEVIYSYYIHRLFILQTCINAIKYPKLPYYTPSTLSFLDIEGVSTTGVTVETSYVLSKLTPTRGAAYAQPDTTLFHSLQLFHRVYTHHSVSELDPKAVAATCLFMSGKLDENYLRIEDIEKLERVSRRRIATMEGHVLRALGTTLGSTCVLRRCRSLQACLVKDLNLDEQASVCILRRAIAFLVVSSSQVQAIYTPNQLSIGALLLACIEYYNTTTQNTKNNTNATDDIMYKNVLQINMSAIISNISENEPNTNVYSTHPYNHVVTNNNNTNTTTDDIYVSMLPLANPYILDQTPFNASTQPGQIPKEQTINERLLHAFRLANHNLTGTQSTPKTPFSVALSIPQEPPNFRFLSTLPLKTTEYYPSTSISTLLPFPAATEHTQETTRKIFVELCSRTNWADKKVQKSLSNLMAGLYESYLLHICRTYDLDESICFGDVITSTSMTIPTSYFAKPSGNTLISKYQKIRPKHSEILGLMELYMHKSTLNIQEEKERMLKEKQDDNSSKRKTAEEALLGTKTLPMEAPLSVKKPRMDTTNTETVAPLAKYDGEAPANIQATLLDKMTDSPMIFDATPKNVKPRSPVFNTDGQLANSTGTDTPKIQRQLNLTDSP